MVSESGTYDYDNNNKSNKMTITADVRLLDKVCEGLACVRCCPRQGQCSTE
jgi:hypothetical protein